MLTYLKLLDNYLERVAEQIELQIDLEVLKQVQELFYWEITGPLYHGISNQTYELVERELAGAVKEKLDAH